MEIPAAPTREKQPKILVFTDLDGTLLDFSSYSFEPARPALSLLEKKNIPLVFCSSKTRSEIETLRAELKNTHPFISENGAAVFIPKGMFPHPFRFDRENAEYFILEQGPSYSRVREVLAKIKARYPGVLRGFGDMDANEVARLCGLSIEDAKRAKQREHEEPFLLQEPSLEDDIRKAAEAFGLRVVRGDRFFHLTGGSHKGKALLRLKRLYEKSGTPVRTIALGDSPNDIPMLRAADMAVLVQKPGGGYDPAVQIPGVVFARGVGPEGWRQAILELLDPS
ncbi:MAG: HAD-IIB family hydrolase [Candidatus Aminicenantales bacterium]